MSGTISIALSTFRDCTRDAVFYVALVVFTGLIFITGQATFFGLGRESEMIREMGLSTITMGGVFLVLVSGTATVALEFRTGALLTVMSKPIRRNEVVLGKYLGMMSVLAVVTAFLTVMFLGMLWLKSEAVTPGLIKAVLLIYLELSMLAALVVFMTLLISRPAAALISFVAFTLGHLSGGPAAWLSANGGCTGGIAASLLPNLEFFRVTQAVVRGHPIGCDYLLLGLAYAASGTALLLLPAMLVFRKREIQ